MQNFNNCFKKETINLSIIVVCYNSEKTIKRCLDSIVSQTHLPQEIIIIDGKSTDKTLEIISEYKEFITTMISEKDDGIYYAMNKGISFVNTDFFMFLNSDDYFRNSNCLSEYENSLKNPEIGLLFSNIRYVDNGKITRIWHFYNVKNVSYLATRIPHPGAVVRKAVIERIGVFNTDFKIAADYDLLLRILLNKVKFEHIKSYIVEMEIGGASDGNILSTIKQNLEIFKSLRLNGYSLVHVILFFFDRVRFKIQQKL